MRKTLLSTLVVALLLGGWIALPAQVASAAELKPLVVIAFSGYDELLSDIGFVGNLAENPELAEGLEGFLMLMTQEKGLAGLDTKRPWGAVVQTDGEEFPIYGFLPVSSLEELMGIAAMLQLEEAPEAPADGIYEFELGGPAVFVQQKGEWAFIAPTREMLADVDADPAKLLGGLDEKYDLAARAMLQNIPPMYREMLIAQIQAGMDMGLQQEFGESDEQYAVRKAFAEKMLDQFQATFDEIDGLLVGLAIDRQTRSCYLDLEITAVEGSTLAKRYAQVAPGPTDFAGFDLPGAALTANWYATASDEDVEQAAETVAMLRGNILAEIEKEGLSDSELELAKQVINDLSDVLQKTIEQRKSDGGMAMLLAPDGLTFAAGMTLADGDKVEEVVRKLAAEGQKEEPELAEILTLDAETYQDVRFHTLAIPTEEMGDEMAERLFGENLDVVLGINDTSVYLAAGRDAAGMLKKVLDQSKAQAGKQVPPMRMSLDVTTVAEFVAEIIDEEEARQMAGMAAAMLGQSGEKDHITITSTPIPNGGKVRLEFEEGFLKLIGSLGEMMGPMIGLPGGPGEGMPAEEFPF